MSEGKSKWGGWNARPLHPELAAKMAKEQFTTVSELALKAGLPRESVRKWLFGERMMPFPAAGKIARTLNISMERLLEIYEEIHPESTSQEACARIRAQGNISACDNNHSIVFKSCVMTA